MQAQALQVGDQLGDQALEYALALAQDVELEKRVRKTSRGAGGQQHRVGPALAHRSRAALRPETLTLSNISKSLALGWWMVQMTVRPPWASDFMRDTTWKQDALSRPLSRERPRGGEVCELGGAWKRERLGWDSYYTGAGAGGKGSLRPPLCPVHTMIQTFGGTKPNVTSIY